jgi:anaphase-promoting complex subunit 5
MEAALPWFQKAEEEYHKLNIFGSLADVQYMLAIVFHNLDRITERDAAAARQVETDEQMSRLEQLVIEDSVVQVWQLVTDVGAALAARAK